MAARAYGAERVPAGEGWYQELGNGWFNVAYLIRLRDGERAVLKIAPPAGVEVMTYERAAMATELAALRLIREQTAVPVPAVHFHDGSHELCDADWFFMQYVDADNLGLVRDSLSPEEYASCQEAVGAANRVLNGIKGERFGPLLGGPPRGDRWREVFCAMVEDVLRDGERRRVDIGWDYDAVRALFAERGDCLEEVTEPVFVEWDLWDPNVMVRDGSLVSLIDHERALYGDPLFEAGFTGAASDVLPGDARSFMRGYGKGPLTATERERRRLYTVHLMLIMVIETVYRGHTDPAQYEFAKAQLAKLLGEFGLRP
ncbi:aminoglycoside phosphotransferase family protein [Streptomyces hoynatensis]|uniref:Aminoglycoside phosphotransferase family protein n=2 Tax=Streptomyces hoynatensis TaxID=1141874 RepID=A0A3A9Z6X1_9ACTN|nr:aminoglycoside phosphotransferase family protein [Streptomyces hoynatensis]